MSSSLEYLTGFGNEHRSEAIAGTLPTLQNSPQKPPRGLYAEQISGTAFTEPRTRNRRTWLYRIRPSAGHPPMTRIDDGALLSAPLPDPPTPNRLRWDPLPQSADGTDFLDGLYTLAANGDVLARQGIGVHLYSATASMERRYFQNSDGEMLIVPQSGPIRVRTELGIVEASPGEIVLIARSIKFAVDLPAGASAGYVCENYGMPFELPELGPIGANGLAHARHFRHPVAAFEQGVGQSELVQKFGGHLWSCTLPDSPLDAVAWHGTHGVYVYDMLQFNVMGTLNWDHPDPSIFTVLTSPSPIAGQANVDFCAFGPRWVVGEHTFRPPHFHRNIMTEFMGLVYGVHDSKAGGFVPGGSSLHNQFAAHGPDLATHRLGSEAGQDPQKFDNALSFMFETRLPLAVTRQAMDDGHRQSDYDAAWTGLEPHFTAEPGD
ncbi:putative dioxygenase [Gordonia hirsuta DSM 44140 = NBRC 16056]|uniref:Homogentisate 1,2-dioxygenase n=1 Tax=Gordonia hirsuta DSM 44140 = NBRC 16056 TaxID=1121927 RepID=L7L6I1_9ACTN|nr:homogentisate 1,2-dioxygenase [Gordonia hirsuta]GAC56361.1 putative dioxygenase [Gordonia hirsuta DSM 44140 = NBRC 16056]